MPGRSRGQLALLQQQDVGFVIAGQMIGGRAANDPATDDGETGRRRSVISASQITVVSQSGFQSGQVLGGVFVVVDIQRRVSFRDHKPHGLAHQ